jgi:hypothetical protein
MDCYLDVVVEALLSQDLLRMKMGCYLDVVVEALTHHRYLMARQRLMKSRPREFLGRLARQVLLKPRLVQQVQPVQLARLQVVRVCQHRALRAPLQSLLELGHRSFWQRSSLLQPSSLAWERRWILRPLQRSLDQGISPSTCAPRVPQRLMMLIGRTRLHLEAWRADLYFLNLNLLLTRKRGPLPQLPSVSKAPRSSLKPKSMPYS